MTALTTSPFLTLPPGMASLTVATMTSPMPAYRRPEPPRTRMQRISLAPVLSATLSRDSCWIIGSSPCRAGSQVGTRAWRNSVSDLGRAPRGVVLLGLLEDLDDAPALRGRQRAGLLDPHAVADAALVLLVVGLQLARAAEDLAVERVLDPVLDGDDDGLLHLVADHETLTDLAVGARDRVAGLVAHVRSFAHAAPSWAPEPAGVCRIPSSRSRTTV